MFLQSGDIWYKIGLINYYSRMLDNTNFMEFTSVLL